MFKIIKSLFPICRSITGPGIKYSLSYLEKSYPILEELNLVLVRKYMIGKFKKNGIFMILIFKIFKQKKNLHNSKKQFTCVKFFIPNK